MMMFVSVVFGRWMKLLDGTKQIGQLALKFSKKQSRGRETTKRNIHQYGKYKIVRQHG
jgi:hypothetical protein